MAKLWNMIVSGGLVGACALVGTTGAFHPGHRVAPHHTQAAVAVVATPVVARDDTPRASRDFERPAIDNARVQLLRAHLHAERVAARRAAAARAARVARARAASTSVCTASNWRRTMTWQEVWIDTRESNMDPTPNDTNPSSGATTLGQLLPSTFRDLGLPISYDPCAELVAQRKYIAERYGSEDAAVAWWHSHNWY